MKQNQNGSTRIRKVALGGVLLGITLVLGLTGWGFIPLPLPIAGATLFHIPVILAGVLFGWEMAILCGLIFGIFAFMTYSMFPWFVMIPGRLLIGVTAYWVFTGILHFMKRKTNPASFILPASVAGIVGSLTNSVLTLGLGVVARVFGPSLPENIAVVVSSIPVIIIEAVAAAIICSAVVVALQPLKFILTIPQQASQNKVNM